ncbi:hypothetical protein DH2020_043629 [Rehmannia glutinosa]|uniref:U1-C C2H2-type zinc finger domain-containing protein n=1 Tax=Rehmannia glutinosa TaxID=99300 RepID=A0ABR0UJ63_REHGL
MPSRSLDYTAIFLLYEKSESSNKSMKENQSLATSSRLMVDVALAPSVRKQHNSGYKHKANIRAYYQKFEEQQTQILIDMKIKEHLGQTAVYNQIGAAYNQHLAAFPGGRPRLPLMPPPMLPLPGPPHQLAPGVRLPVLPVPVPVAPGYATAPGVPMQPPPASSLPLHLGGAPAPSPVPGGGPPPSSSGMQPAATQLYNVNPTGTTSATVGGYSYPQASQTSH